MLDSTISTRSVRRQHRYLSSAPTTAPSNMTISLRAQPSGYYHQRRSRSSPPRCCITLPWSLSISTLRTTQYLPSTTPVPHHSSTIQEGPLASLTIRTRSSALYNSPLMTSWPPVIEPSPHCQFSRTSLYSELICPRWNPMQIYVELWWLWPKSHLS